MLCVKIMTFRNSDNDDDDEEDDDDSDDSVIQWPIHYIYLVSPSIMVWSRYIPDSAQSPTLPAFCAIASILIVRTMKAFCSPTSPHERPPVKQLCPDVRQKLTICQSPALLNAHKKGFYTTCDSTHGAQHCQCLFCRVVFLALMICNLVRKVKPEHDKRVIHSCKIGFHPCYFILLQTFDIFTLLQKLALKCWWN